MAEKNTENEAGEKTDTAKTQIHSFSDFANLYPLEGPAVNIKSILNKRILVKNYRVTDSKFKDKGSRYCVTVQFETEEGSTCVFFTGSEVLRDQLDRYKEQLPYWATVVQAGQYYSFS